jgi:hypothetical protein
MTDKLEVLRATPTITAYGETVVDESGATVVQTCYGSLQLYFSAEYDIDRDTYSRIGRIICDDPTFDPQPKDWVRVNDGETYEIDGKPQTWTLRGRHHLEVGIKKIEG